MLIFTTAPSNFSLFFSFFFFHNQANILSSPPGPGREGGVGKGITAKTCRFYYIFSLNFFYLFSPSSLPSLHLSQHDAGPELFYFYLHL